MLVCARARVWLWNGLLTLSKKGSKMLSVCRELNLQDITVQPEKILTTSQNIFSLPSATEVHYSIEFDFDFVLIHFCRLLLSTKAKLIARL